MAQVQDNIAPLLIAVRDYLGTSLTALLDGQRDQVVLDNIGRPNEGLDIDTGGATFLTLVRTEEDASRQERRNVRKVATPGAAAPGIIRRNPPVNLNLYLLITANHDSYEDALNVLSEIVATFQQRNILNAADLNLSANAFFSSRQLKFTMMSPSLEEWNHLWSMLGGKQLPALLYMVQALAIEYIPDTELPGSPIREIHLTETIV
jgi:hypothetical protein